MSERALAVLALLAAAALAVAAVLFLAANALFVALGVAGVMVAVAGGWWAITTRMPRRLFGLAAAGAGALVLLAATIGAGGDSTRLVLRLAVSAVLLAVAIAAARAALVAELRPLRPATSHSRLVPRRPVLICNPKSGGGKVQRFGLLDLATSLGIETVVLEPGMDLEALARDAIRRGADCLGMAGGDGSQALVASIAIEKDVPFVCVSAGTRNHFALDLGLDREDPRRSVYAFRDAVERRVDYATVNGRLFVNNVSLGVYATIVQQEGYREAKAETSMALLPTLLGQTETPFDLQFTAPDGTEVDGAFLVMVSNNPYILGAALDAAQRRRMDSGELGVFAVSAETGVQAAEVFTLALAGRSSLSGSAFQFTSADFEVRSRSGRAFAGVDGEALELPTPLVFRTHPRGLRMLVPEGNLELAVQREARDVHFGDLLTIARGMHPRGPVAVGHG